MGTYQITEEQFDDFESEMDTEPYMLMTVTEQMEASHGLLSGAVLAHSLTPIDPPPTWMDRLELELMSADKVMS